MIKVARIILPKLDLICVTVVKETLSVLFSERNAFARPIVSASFYAAFKSRA